MVPKRTGWSISALFGAAVIAMTGLAAPAYAVPNRAGSDEALTIRQGQWSVDAGAGRESPLSSLSAARPEIAAACPSGMPTSGPYSCLVVILDGSGHEVMIRHGQSGDSGFGFLHALVDHDLDLGPIETIIENSAYGIRQSNGNYLYGEYYASPPAGEVAQYVNVYEDRSEAGNHDGHPLGLITAYCQGPGHSYEAKCPEWVNETL